MRQQLSSQHMLPLNLRWGGMGEVYIQLNTLPQKILNSCVNIKLRNPALLKEQEFQLDIFNEIERRRGEYYTHLVEQMMAEPSWQQLGRGVVTASKHNQFAPASLSSMQQYKVSDLKGEDLIDHIFTMKGIPARLYTPKELCLCYEGGGVLVQRGM